MTVKEFDEKYGLKGGITKLTELRSLFYTQEYIAAHFSVTRERVRQWMLEFFGSAYDPRPDRREMIIASMVDFAKTNPKEEFDFAFKGTEYYKEVLEKCKQERIYDTQ